MLKKWLKRILLTILMIGTFAVSLYAFSPQLTRLLLTYWLTQQGFESVVFEMQAPKGNELIVKHLALSHTQGQRQLSITIDSLALHYDWPTLLHTRQLNGLWLPHIDIRIDIDTSLPERLKTLQQQSIDLHPQQLSALFASLPAQHLQVDHINIRYQAEAAPALTASGTLQINPQGAQSTWQTPLADLTAKLSLDGQVEVTLSQQHLLLAVAGELSFLDDHWQLHLGNQAYTEPLLDWLKQHLAINLMPSIHFEDPVSFSTHLRLPRILPLDPSEWLETLYGELTLATRIHPAQTASLPYQLQLDLLTQLQLKQREIDGNLQISAIETAGQLPRIEMRSQLTLPPSLDTIDLNGTLKVDDLAQPIRFSTHLVANTPAQVRWQLSDQEARALMSLLTTYVSSIPPALQVESGRVNASGTLSLSPERWALTAQSQLTNATLLLASTRLEGALWQSQWRIDQSGRWNNTGTITLDRIVYGLPLSLSPLEYDIRQETDRLQLSTSTLTADLLGGRVYLPALTFDPRAPELLFLVSLRALDLGEILALYAEKGLYGEGHIDGQLPIQLNHQGLRIDGGNVGTTAPGVIRYLPDEGLQSMATGNLGLRLALDALSDLQYQLLDLDVFYQPNGDLTLRSRLKGNNPQWQQGRPIDLSLTIEDNIPDLLRALQITGRITDAVDQHFQR